MHNESIVKFLSLIEIALKSSFYELKVQKELNSYTQ